MTKEQLKLLEIKVDIEEAIYELKKRNQDFETKIKIEELQWVLSLFD